MSKNKVTKPRDPLLSNSAVVIYREIAHFCPNHIQRESIALIVQNERIWRAVVHEWLNSGWNPRNVAGMLRLYAMQAGNGFNLIHGSKFSSLSAGKELDALVPSIGSLPEGVGNWKCTCGFSVIQNGNGLKECPIKDCGKTLRLDIP